jgi:hypothetical protein
MVASGGSELSIFGEPMMAIAVNDWHLLDYGSLPCDFITSHLPIARSRINFSSEAQ